MLNLLPSPIDIGTPLLSPGTAWTDENHRPARKQRHFRTCLYKSWYIYQQKRDNYMQGRLSRLSPHPHRLPPPPRPPSRARQQRPGSQRSGSEKLESFGDHDGLPLGFEGHFPFPVDPAELVDRCRKTYGQEPLTFLEGPDPVKTVGIISGAAQRDLYQAIDEGLDAYITGEVSEWVMNVAREAKIHYLACGHYATERLGIRALGEHLAGRFG